MSPVHRPLSGDVLVVDLGDEPGGPAGAAEAHTRQARTLLKSGPLRVALVAVAPGGEIAEHEAGGTITVQPLTGRLRFTANGAAHDLGPGQLLLAEPGVRHAVESDQGATFLLTVARTEAGGETAEVAAPVEIGRAKKTAAPPEPEAWLRGPVQGVPPGLMPAAHVLIQAREDLEAAASGLTPEQLWARPGGAASIGFHLQHIVGSLDRLLTYARGESLSPAQTAAKGLEGVPGAAPPGADQLLAAVRAAVDRALDTLRATPAAALLEARAVGKARLPSNVLGLLFHAAEHTQRHTGQVIATARVLRGPAGPG